MSKEKTAFIPKQYFAVVAVLLAIMMSVLDGTIMNSSFGFRFHAV